MKTLKLLTLTFIFAFTFAQDNIICSHMKSAMTMFEDYRPMTRNQSDYDVTYYDIDLEIFPNSETISGDVGITFYPLVDNFTQVEIDLTYNLNITSVMQNGMDLNYNHQTNNLLVVDLLESASIGEIVTISVQYNGAPESSGFGSFGFSSAFGEDMIWTLSEPYGSRNWWPCKDTPTDKADSVDISVKVPSNLIVASNGLLAQTVSDLTHTTYHWEERYPIATYLVSLAIYPYEVFYDWFHYGENDSMRLDYYVYPEHVNSVMPNYLLTKDMISAFSDRFGLYPFIEEKYGHAEFVWGGGMEHQTMTSMGGSSQYLISHELGHQWWGDMVTCGNFHHIWLNEGFATYSQAMWEEIHNGGLDALHDEMSSKSYLGSGTIFVADTTNIYAIFNGNLSYNKASWVLHMLRHILGDETFFGGLQEYGDQYRFDSAVTEQFTTVMSEFSGRDLSPFINRWIYGEYYPNYQSSPTYADLGDGNYQVNVTISQTQNSDIFQMPVDVRINHSSGYSDFVAEVTEEEQLFSFILDTEPSSVQLDPDHWILRMVTHDNLVETDDVYGCTDSNATNYYPLATIDDGSCEYTSSISDKILPIYFSLTNPYPNPFNPSTVIGFTIPVDISENVSLQVFDINGRLIKTLLHDNVKSGYHEIAWDATELPSGMYFVKLNSGKISLTEKMILLK
jgi:aminopeptidase N